MGKNSWRFKLIRGPAQSDEFVEWLHQYATFGSTKEIPLVAASYLSNEQRRALERHGLSYLDSHGHCHLVGPNLLVHIEGGAISTAASAIKTESFGIDGVRTVQALFDNLKAGWSVKDLAQQAGVAPSQAHRVLTLLERQDLVASTGAGPRKRRQVVNPSDLLDWLAAQKVSMRRNAKQEVYLYARTPKDLWTSASNKLTAAGIRHSLTGSAAVALYGTGPTSVQRSTFRIDPEITLEAATQALGAEETTRAANLVLMKDVGRVGTHLNEKQSDVAVAPKVRIYIDSLTEKRGDDIAKLFRESVLGY